MRRLYYLIAALVAVIAGLLIYNHTREDRWRKMPLGGEVRLRGVIFEAEPHSPTDTALRERLRRSLGPHWGAVVGSTPLPIYWKLKHPELTVWMQLRNAADAVDSVHYKLVMDGKLVHSNHEGSITSGSESVGGASFDIDPFTERRLRIRIEKSEQAIEFEIANPFYDPSKSSETTPSSIPGLSPGQLHYPFSQKKATKL